MKQTNKLKQLVYIIALVCAQNLARAQNNNFLIGMMGLEYNYTTDANGIVTSPKIGGYNSSWMGLAAADGFNTAVVTTANDTWMSSNSYKQYITLLKNNGMQLLDYSNYFYKPSAPNSSTGKNQYAITGCDKICVNLNARYSQIYNDPSLSSAIYGHHLGGELSCNGVEGHGFPKLNLCPSFWSDANDAEHNRGEMPPQNLSDAILNFKTVRSQKGVNNQKIIFGVATHGNTIDNAANGDLFEERDYINMPGVTNPQKADGVIESSYFTTHFSNWVTPTSSTLNYLGKFRSIDYIRTKYNTVIAEMALEIDPANPPTYYSLSSNLSVKNANQLWFQTYTSIIHKVEGVEFYTLPASQDFSIQTDVDNNNYRNNAANADRYEVGHAPLAYQNHIRFLGQELAYLAKKNFLSPTESTIVYSKTTDADVNCILPASSTYLPSTVVQADARDIYRVRNESPRSYPNYHRTEENGLRYTIRTNGNEVIMIISNPNPYPLNSVSLDFNNLSNNIIKNSTGVKVLFESANPTYATVMSTSYKTTRSSGINLNNLAIDPTSYLINYSGSYKAVSLSFGPFDVHILKFVTGSIPNYNNGWDLAWTNGGSRSFGGWGPLATDKYIPGDFDGNGTQELLAVQSNANAWSTMLNYQNNTWNWGWSNYGNNAIGGWQLAPTDLFYAGNFDGVAGDELLCAAGGGTYIALFKFVSGNWTLLWSNGGNVNSDFFQYRNNLVIGDFNRDGKADAVGSNGDMIKMFSYISNDFTSVWNSGGSTSHTLYSYRKNLRAGDYNGDGKTDLLGMNGSWATTFYYNTSVSGSWQFGESTYGGNTAFGGWGLPALSNDNFLVGNLDTDAKDEVFCIQGGTSGAWATTVSTNTTGGFSYGWTNNASPAYIDDWAVSETGGSGTKYWLVKPTTSSKKYLLAMRTYGCGNYLINMYQTNTTNNYRPLGIDETKAVVDNHIAVYPNPATDEFKINYSLSEANGNVKIELYNTVGQLIKETTVGGIQGTNENSIDVSDVAKGMYIIRVVKEGNSFSEKVSIQR